MCCSVCTLKDFLVRFNYKNNCDGKHTCINTIHQPDADHGGV